MMLSGRELKRENTVAATFFVVDLYRDDPKEPFGYLCWLPRIEDFALTRDAGNAHHFTDQAEANYEGERFCRNYPEAGVTPALREETQE